MTLFTRIPHTCCMYVDCSTLKPNNFLCYDCENLHMKRQHETFIVYLLATEDIRRRANAVRRTVTPVALC